MHLLVACRGIVAVLVMLHHASVSVFPAPQYWGATVFGGIFNFPYGRITFFFVLSGFLLGYVHTRDFGQPARYVDYALRRVRSIYPFYWVVLGAVLVAGFSPFGWAAANHPSASNVIASALLIGPDAQDNVLGVAWTLYHEILFYALFGLLILNRRLGVAALALWTGLFVASLAGLRADWVPAYVTRPVNLLFLYGFVAARLVQHQRVPIPGLLILASGLFMLAMIRMQLSEPTDEVTQRQVLGVAWAVMLAGLATVELRRQPRVPRFLIELGAASFALFLCHFTLLLILAKLAAHAGLVGRVPVEIGFVATVTITLAAAIAIHRLAERPLSTWLRGRVPPAPARHLPAARLAP